MIDDPENDFIYLITDYYSEGSLGDKLKQTNEQYYDHNKLCKEEGRFSDIITKGLPSDIVRLYFIDMLKALFYCH